LILAEVVLEACAEMVGFLQILMGLTPKWILKPAEVHLETCAEIVGFLTI
jgi:hypothetical protein